MPGVVRADVVYVQSENMREVYIQKLTDFAGEATRNVWEKKIAVAEPIEYDNINRKISEVQQNQPVSSANIGMQSTITTKKENCLFCTVGLTIQYRDEMLKNYNLYLRYSGIIRKK